MTVEERFNYWIDKSQECWVWNGTIGDNKYGQFYAYGKKHLAHRFAYELAFGSIPKGFCVMHSCDNPPCVNPNHLSAGTSKDNTHDMIRKGRQKCGIGERQHCAKLKESDVLRIREIAKEASRSSIAKEYGVDPSLISRIVNGKYWKHL
jgi:hypothetical protein